MLTLNLHRVQRFKLLSNVDVESLINWKVELKIDILFLGEMRVEKFVVIPISCVTTVKLPTDT